jgi:hypothetical protein
LWAVPLVIGHVVMSVAIMKGYRGPLPFFDIGVLGCLAFVLSRRFRDIGWPAWIGPTILLGTVVVIPWSVVGVAYVTHLAPLKLLWSLGLIGLANVAINFVLLVVAGSVAGKPRVAAAELAAQFD